MAVLSAQSIRERCRAHRDSFLVWPFYERQEVVWHSLLGRWLNLTASTSDSAMIKSVLTRGLKRFSHGLSTCGYDVRIAEDLWLWPFFGRLASTVERFDMPVDVMAEVKDKSSWARRFVTVQNTVIEPGWRGYLTLELTNHRPWPRFIRKGTPIAQIVFYQLDKPSEQPYAGKYQDQQAGPQSAR